MHHALLIFNPRAGRAPAGHAGGLDRARKIMAAHGIESELALTTEPGSASELARQAVRQGRELVIACGGDGTLNEVVNGLAGSAVALALLPAGTANVLAKEIGLPWNIDRAAALVAGSARRRIALGTISTGSEPHQNRYFLSVGGDR